MSSRRHIVDRKDRETHARARCRCNRQLAVSSFEPCCATSCQQGVIDPQLMFTNH
jgi:hypothetical protein